MGWHTKFEIFGSEIQVGVTPDGGEWIVATSHDYKRETNETRRIVDRFKALLGNPPPYISAEDAKDAVEKVFRKLECNWTGWEFFDPTKR